VYEAETQWHVPRMCEDVLCAAIKGHDNTLKGAARPSGCQN